MRKEIDEYFAKLASPEKDKKKKTAVAVNLSPDKPVMDLE